MSKNRFVSLQGYSAFNHGEFDLENMSFFKTKEKATNFHKGQQIAKVTVVLDLIGEIKKGNCKNCGHEMHTERCGQVIRYSSIDDDGKEISDYMECCCCEPGPEKEEVKK